jgi:hypothetical protein
LKAEKEESASTLTDELTNIDKAIRQWEVAKQAAMVAESVEDTAEAMRNLKRLRADREAMEQKANAATKEVNSLEECGDLLCEATQAWNGMTFAKQQRLVRLIVGHANIEEDTPHILKLTVHFSEPVNHVLV